MVSAKRRAVRIFGREYTVILPSLRDPRMHVAAMLVTLQVLGQTVLGFRLSVAQILICMATGALIEFVVTFFKDSAIMWPASGLQTGNSTAFILRTPGTLHGQWWSTHGIWIFVGVVAISMASKYLIRWKGRHIFNPSNLGLVIAFVALGPQYTEPLDLWWIPFGPWMIVTYAILLGGGLLLGPTTLEFWTKTAILGSLVIACAGRFGLARLMAPFDEGFRFTSAVRQMSWRAPAAFFVAAICVGCVPISSDIATHNPTPAA